MPKMTPSALTAMLQSQHGDTLAAQTASKLAGARTDAMDYYLGDMKKDMPAPEGRSQAVSSDVADTVEGMMPNLMEIFFGGDETVTFEPVGPEDVQAAEQESDYVNHVFNQVNPGFLILYTFIKDSLLSKNGFVKVFWDERTVEEKETYYDLPDDQFAVLLADDEVEIVAHTEHRLGEEPDDEDGEPVDDEKGEKPDGLGDYARP